MFLWIIKAVNHCLSAPNLLEILENVELLDDKEGNFWDTFKEEVRELQRNGSDCIICHLPAQNLLDILEQLE